LGFGFFFGSVMLIRFKNQILQKESHRPWVQALAESETTTAQKGA
jgi:heme exporter protein C